MIRKISAYFMYIAMALGLLLPGPAIAFKDFLSPVLVLLMAHSLVQFEIRDWKKKNLFMGVNLTIIHFFLLSILYLIASLFISHQGYREGFILLAVTPPAIGIIAIAKIVHGRIGNTFLGLVLSYGFSFIFLPIIMYLFLGKIVGLFLIIKTILIYIILPYIISRFLKKFISNNTNDFLINLLYGVLFYIIIGSKSTDILNDFNSLWVIFLIMFMLSFVLGGIIFWFSRNYDYLLFGTYKNVTLGFALGLALFSSDALIPLSIRSFFSPMLTIAIFSLKNFLDGKHAKIPKHL